MTRTIRRLVLPEIGTLLGWACDEGWNPGRTDATAFASVDPDGLIGAFVGGQMVAAIAAVAYDAKFGFIGLYICHPAYRGQGHGRAVWDAGIAHLGQRTIGLDGVPEQQANYARMGFAIAYQTMRMTALAPAGAMAGDLVPVQSARVLQALDRQCFPAERGRFVGHWLEPPNRGLALMRDGAVAGCVVIRPCVEGHKIGPLFAADDADAKVLLAGAMHFATGMVQIDVPRSRSAFLATLGASGFAPGFATARMYRGAAPAIDMTRVFGITSLELG
ncbi:GNAT family N-acetyltransferase [uncultured Devosia sp.]|uniref:GNAT family N-acetyltransferase n=1 Tax=uncultured Devosia sp. TaxID=211434 RepID=UPI0035CA3B0E